MRGRLGFGVIALAAIGSLLLSACGQDGTSEAGGAQGPYRIMLSGGSEAGAITDQLLDGVACARAGAKVANENGGINGRQIELIESPDNADPAAALTALNEQIAEQRPDAYLLSANSNLSAAVAQTLNRNEVMFLDTGNAPATNDPKNNPFAFHPGVPAEDVLASFIPEFQANRYQRIGVLHGNSAYAQEFGEQAQRVFTDAGYQVVGNVEYDSSTLDMTPQISELRAAAPDVVVFNAYGPPVGHALEGLDKIGWDVPLLGDTSVTATPLATTPPPEGLVGTPLVANLKMQVTRSMIPSEAGQDTKRAAEAIKAAGGLRTTFVNCLNYDAVMLLAAAGNAARSTDVQAIAEAFYDPAVTRGAATAIYPEVTFSRDSHEPTIPAGTYAFVPPTPVVNGQLAPAGS